MLKKLRAINNFFSAKHDLLAIGLFLGASIALMLSEAFDWFLHDFITRAIPESNAWFAVIAFLVLFLKIFCIAFVLFDIDWLYNRFVRKRRVQAQASFTSTQDENFIQQEVGKPVALEDFKESKMQLKERLKKQLKKDQALQLQSQGFEVKDAGKQRVFIDDAGTVKSGFIVEYLQGHDSDLSDEQVNRGKVENLVTSRLSTSQELSRSQDKGQTDSQAIDLIAMLKQDLQDVDVENGYLRRQKNSPFQASDLQALDLSPERIRGILARN